jgi:hypothetical protein
MRREQLLAANAGAEQTTSSSASQAGIKIACLEAVAAIAPATI